MQFMVIFIALFEVIGIASIAPFMAVVATPESINTNKYLRFIFDFFTCETSNEFLVILGGIVFGFILIGNVLNLGMRWFMIYSGYQIGRKLEVRLFKSYLSEDYFFHTQKNSSILTKNIVHEVVRLTHNIVVQLLTLNARFFTILFIMIGLIVVNYKVTLVASILYGISYILIYSVIRRKLTLNSKKASKYSGKKYQIISEALGGIKELKLHGKEELYVNDYDGVSEKCVHVTTYNTIIVHISRSFLEIMSFGIIISAVVLEYH